MKMVNRVLMAVLIAAVGFPVIYFGNGALDALIGLLTLLLAYEAAKMRDFKQAWLLACFIVLAITTLSFCGQEQVSYLVSAFLLLIFFIPYLSADYKLLDVLTLAVMVLLTAYGFRGVRAIRQISLSLTLMTIIATVLADTFAFFVGSFLGKHKLAPHISPNKTIEGSLGGWLGAALFVVIYSYVLLPDVSLLLMALIATFMPLVTQIGDLSFSLIKRNYNLKDFSLIFGTHGGCFDRLDSLLFAFAFMNFLINVVAVYRK